MYLIFWFVMDSLKIYLISCGIYFGIKEEADFEF